MKQNYKRWDKIFFQRIFFYVTIFNKQQIVCEYVYLSDSRKKTG